MADIPADKLWPPDWDTWEYNGFFYNLSFDFAKIEMTESLDELIDQYQTYEALVVKEQMEYIRQRKYRPIGSMYLYYWRDPCPIIGSGLLDYYGRRYKVYEAFASAYTQVFISLERDADPYILGREKVYEPGGRFTGKVWVVNDLNDEVESAAVHWRVVEMASGDVVAGNTLTASLPAQLGIKSLRKNYERYHERGFDVTQGGHRGNLRCLAGREDGRSAPRSAGSCGSGR